MIKIKKDNVNVIMYYDKDKVKCRSVILKDKQYIYCYDNNNDKKESIVVVKVC